MYISRKFTMIKKSKTKPASLPSKVVAIKVNPQKVIPRNSFTTQVKNVTTVHGTSHFGSRSGRSLVLWCTIFLCNVALTTFFLIVIREKFNENQIVTQVNANCKVSQVPFPAVSICNFNIVSVKESANIVSILRKSNVPQKEIERFFNSLHYLTNFDKNSRNLSDFSDIMDILKRHYFTIDNILEEIHQKCANLLVYCTFNRKPKRCTEIFSMIKTLEGYCCTFNYAGPNNDDEVSLLPPDQDFEYYNDQTDEDIFGRIIMTSESGSTTGLSVVLDFEPNDYPSWSILPYYGAKIVISDPSDYPETNIVYRYISLGEWVEVKVEAQLFQSSTELRIISPEKRGCLFYDEMLLEHSDRYSYETCSSECKIKTYLESCGCVPFKYPPDKTSRVCELRDLKCLNNVTANKAMINLNCNSICHMECRDKRYTITSDLAPFVADIFPHNITQNQNTSELSALQVYFGKSNCNCFKKNLLIDFNYFIATYGGVFSLSFGASILTLFELSFIFCKTVAKSTCRDIVSLRRKYER